MDNTIEHKTTPANQTPQAQVDYDFGCVDTRGRAIGAYVRTWEIDFVPITPETADSSGYLRTFGWYRRAPGHYFAFLGQATRNGGSYGSGNFEQYFSTAAERDAAIEKYLKGARKRAAKLAVAK